MELLERQQSTISNSIRYDKLRCKHPFAMVGRGMQNLGLYSELTSGRRDLYRAKTSVTRDFGFFFLRTSPIGHPIRHTRDSKGY